MTTILLTFVPANILFYQYSVLSMMPAQRNGDQCKTQQHDQRVLCRVMSGFVFPVFC